MTFWSMPSIAGGISNSVSTVFTFSSVLYWIAVPLTDRSCVRVWKIGLFSDAPNTMATFQFVR